MERANYFIRRLLLAIPTFLGITFIVFALCQFVPGGPVEQMMLRMRGVGGGGEGRATGSAAVSISQEQRKALEKHFGFDRPIPERYWNWLVKQHAGLTVDSYMYPNKTVWQLIKQRFPVSLIFGITGFVLTYLVCIPLGIAKAMRNGGAFDLASSVIVFTGYAIPAFAFGMILKIMVCGTTDGFWNLLPATGFHSDGWSELPPFGRFLDTLRHMVLPVFCYMLGNFAVLTLLMKNSLLEQIGQDYIRTVLAKGATIRRAVWGHAFRNALIPIATGFGDVMTLMFAGSVLIERVFEIPGMGRLSLDAIIGRDYMVFMGILSLTSILGLVGRMVSDFAYVLIDPRINFRSS